MTIKEQLQELRHIDKDIDCLQQQLDLEMTKIKTTNYADDRVQASNHTDIYDKVDSYNDLIIANIDKLVDKKRKLRVLVDRTLSGPEWKVINYYYFCKGYTWEKIAVEMNYCCQHIYRLHGSALQKLRKDAIECDS